MGGLIMTKIIDYKDIMKNRYSITDDGVVTNLKSGKIVRYNNPKNNNGYYRITLRTANKKSKKYAVHRLVMATFVHDSDLEVNHKDGNKINNKLSNLEYVTGDENKHHAKMMGFYQACEDRYNAVFTNDTVKEMCKLFEKGKTPMKVIRKLGIEPTPANITAVVRIFHKHTWCRISKNYNWDPYVTKYKVYSREHLDVIAYLIQFSTYTNNEICDFFPCYDKRKLRNVIEKMRSGKLYKKIMKEAKRSTTIQNRLYDSNGFIILV